MLLYQPATRVRGPIYVSWQHFSPLSIYDLNDIPSCVTRITVPHPYHNSLTTSLPFLFVVSFSRDSILHTGQLYIDTPIVGSNP